MDALQIVLYALSGICLCGSFYHLGKAVAWREADQILKRAMGTEKEEHHGLY